MNGGSNMPHLSLEVVWATVVELAGEEFKTVTGKPFTYEISGDTLIPSRTEYILSKSELGKALELVPCSGPGVMVDLVRGPSYLWAILHDHRLGLVKQRQCLSFTGVHP